MPSPTRPSARADSTRPALDVVHGGVTHRVTVKRVASARRFTLRVRTSDHVAVLTMPTRGSLKTARAFAERHAEWIGARLGALPGRVALLPGTVLPLRGIDHVIVSDPTSLRRVQPGIGSGGEALLRVSSREADPARAIHAYLLGQARLDLAAAVQRHAEALGRSVTRITLRDTRSRWGSCSSRGALNFSWRLILAPPAVLDYLAAHEVAHLVYLDHSDGFWRVTRGLAPAMDDAERWLKAHGSSLHRFLTP